MNSRDVVFYSRGVKLAGKVNVPDDYQAGTKLPCIIPCSGYTGIGAAYPSLLSRMFTKHGYATVTFDYTGWAPSEGEPGHTTAEGEYDDILAAYIFATQQPEIQAENIGLFGWGFAAATVLKITADYPEIKAVGCGNGIYNGDECLRSVLSWEDYVQFKKIARADLVKRVMTGEMVKVPPYQTMGNTRGYSYRTGKIEPLTLQWMIDNVDVAYNKEDFTNTHNFMDVLGVPEAIERDYGGRENFPPYHTLESTDSFLRIDAFYDVQRLAPRPVFIVHAVEDGTYPIAGAKAIAKAIGATCTTCWVPGDHNDFMFDDDPNFALFSESIVSFYDKALK